jgi:hypothetical protein
MINDWLAIAQEEGGKKEGKEREREIDKKRGRRKVLQHQSGVADERRAV